MKIDTSDYYPTTPGSSCEEEHSDSWKAKETDDHLRFMPGHGEETSPSAPEDNPGGSNGDAAIKSDSATAGDRGPAGGNGESVGCKGEPTGRDKDAADTKSVDLAANIISWVLVPLLIPTYAMVLIFQQSVLFFIPFGMKLAFTGIIFGVTALIPMLMVLLLKKLGYVEDLGLNGRKERLIPYLIMILSYSFCGFYMGQKGAPDWVSMFFYGGALAAFINMVVNFRWKISAHAAAMGGIIALLISISKDGIGHPDLVWLLAATVLLAGLLGAARVWLGRHTVMQVLCGTAVGFLSVFLLCLYQQPVILNT